ncbi:hypothetical protein PTKIN_Ptkin14bG0158000 [Pterospermum kingtungense]
MASFKVLFCLSLLVLFLVSSSGARLFHQFSIFDRVLEDAKAQNKASTDDGQIIDRHFESKKLSDIGQTTLAVAAKEDHKASIESFEASETGHESKQSRRSSKRALVEEGEDAIQASIERNGGNLFKPERLSPGGPDPHHH